MRGSRDAAKLASWKSTAGGAAEVGSPSETARFGEVVVIAVKGTAAEEALRLCGIDNLTGKIVIDTCNPISDAPPVNGVLSFFTGPNESLLERLQKSAPTARFVKAFSSVGSALMVDPRVGGTRPTMFICGNDAAAKRDVTGILDRFGWLTEDLGTTEAARAIEPLCILWCIPGLRGHGWMHALKLLR
jgi:predicted dinucleotide-binding enzyme